MPPSLLRIVPATRRHVSTILLALVALLGSCSWAGAQETSTVQVQGIHDQFVLCLAEDRRQAAWIGTEDQGVWRLDEAAGRPRWTQYTRPHGLGDESIHAIACDQQGRIWAGHLSHGVSVFDGQRWRNYSVGEGPIGERVFDIEVCPTDGDVWIATSCGLSRYSVRAKTWSHFTQEDGLPENGIYRLAFAPNGDVVVGTESHGLALASAAASYRSWRSVSGPRSLPSDLINDVLVTRSGIIYAATTNGLARSEDKGSTWRVLRGRDAAAKAITYLQYTQPKSAASLPEAALPLAAPSAADSAAPPASPSPQASPVEAPLLEEDYVSCLAQDRDGRLWLGYRRDGYEVRDAQTLRVLSHQVQPDDGQPRPGDDFARSILPRSTGASPLIGFYGRGTAPAQDQLRHTPGTPPPVPETAALPAPAGLPTQAELAGLLRRLAQVRPAPASEAPLVAALEDDWGTQGDWLGRYGRYQAILAAIVSPRDYVWGAGEKMMPYDVRIGPHRTPDDSVRYWIQWLSTTTPEALEMPPTYYDSRVTQGWNKEGQRREAEWDDHGEEYPMALDGPHVYTSIQVPAGWFILSLYSFNKDGQQGSNRWRDYRLSVRERPAKYGLETVRGFEEWPQLAQGRIHDFRGGVWKRYLVRGPQALTVEVNRNYSFNTILAGLFLDRLEEQPAPYFGSTQQWQALQAERESQSVRLSADWNTPGRLARFAPGKDAAESARRLYAALQEVRLINPAWHETEGRRYYLALMRWCRVALGEDTTKAGAQARTGGAARDRSWRRECLKSCLYQLHLYSQWEEQQRSAGLRPARDIEKALRWDGKSNNSRRGKAVVEEYLLRNARP